MRRTLAIATALLSLAVTPSTSARVSAEFPHALHTRTAHPPGIPHYTQLMAIGRCETGGINGGRPLWTHRTRDYGGALGFLHSTWTEYRRERQGKRVGMPLYAWNATPRQQLLVGEILIRTFDGYSSWPACSVRLGLR